MHNRISYPKLIPISYITSLVTNRPAGEFQMHWVNKTHNPIWYVQCNKNFITYFRNLRTYILTIYFTTFFLHVYSTWPIQLIRKEGIVLYKYQGPTSKNHTVAPFLKTLKMLKKEVFILLCLALGSYAQNSGKMKNFKKLFYFILICKKNLWRQNLCCIIPSSLWRQAVRR